MSFPGVGEAGVVLLAGLRDPRSPRPGAATVYAPAPVEARSAPSPNARDPQGDEAGGAAGGRPRPPPEAAGPIATDTSASAVSLSRAAASVPDEAGRLDALLALVRVRLYAALPAGHAGDPAATSPAMAPILATLDRRALFAIAVAANFSEAERAFAMTLLAQRAADVLKAVGLLGGGQPGLHGFEVYAGYLDGAGPEERRSPEWRIERELVRLAADAFVRGATRPAATAETVQDLVETIGEAQSLAPSSGRPAEAAGIGASAPRDMPILFTGFVSQEMLLAALAAALRLPSWRLGRMARLRRARSLRSGPADGGEAERPNPTA